MLACYQKTKVIAFYIDNQRPLKWRLLRSTISLQRCDARHTVSQKLQAFAVINTVFPSDFHDIIVCSVCIHFIFC